MPRHRRLPGFRSILAFLWGLLAVPGLARAQGPVVVEGTVLDRATNAPVVHASVEIEGFGQQLTDQHGRFRFGKIPIGPVTMRAGQLGYAQWVARHIVTANGEPLRIVLEPNPVVLAGIRVFTDRLKARRNAIPYSVRAYGEEQLAASAAWDGFDFIRSRTPVLPCGMSLNGSWCIRYRGSYIRPRVVVDEAPFIGGLDVLIGWSTDDLYLIEVIQNGRQIRVYTKRFATLLATGRARLQPVIY